MVDTRKAVSLRILELCEQYNMSVHALARTSTVPTSTLKNVINGGSRNAGVVTIKQSCDGVGIALGQFFSSERFDSLDQEIK